MRDRLIFFFLPLTFLYGATSPCDLNGDGKVNAADVELAANQAVDIDPCGSADLDQNGQCDAVDLQRFVNAAQGQECRAAPPPPPPPPPGGGSALTSYGAKCDGSTDDRDSIQRAFNDASKWANKTLFFPAGKTCIIRSGIMIINKSGWTIEGQGATIKAASGMCLSGCGPLVTLNGVDQFAINNLNLDGNRANRTPAEKFGGHNFNILQATNGTFKNVTSINAATDNARIAAANAGDTKTFSKNLTFTDSKFSNAYRNSVSVIEGWNIKFLGTCTPGSGGNMFLGTCTCQFTNANGTAPKAGLGWEPNHSSAWPGVDNGLVDGCLMEGNRGSGVYASGSTVRNLTIRNSIIRNNGSEGGLTGANDGGAVAVKASGALIENNYIGRQAGSRFAVIYVAEAKTSNLRPWQFKNNHIDGVPPVAQSNGSRRVLHCGNFGDGTAQFKNNTMTNIGVGAAGDWCSPDSDTCGVGSTVENNEIEGKLQVPNPGCP